MAEKERKMADEKERKGKWQMNHPVINMTVEVDILIIARVQATVKPLDLPRVLPRPATSIEGELNGG